MLRLMTKITFLRHGATDANTAGYFAGKEDLPLNEVGEQEAARVAEELKDREFDVMVYGCRKRVEQTAQIVLKQLRKKPKKVVENPDIYELDFGKFEGLNYMEIEQKYPAEWNRYLEHWQNYNFPGGSNSQKFFGHCGEIMFDIKNEYAGKKILLVGHKGFILCAMAFLNGGTIDDISKYAIGTAQTLEAEVDRESED